MAEELIQLSEKSEHWQAVLLSRPEVPNDLGASGNYRLATLVMGCRGVRIYEAVSGTAQHPSGRHMHVALSFEEMDHLIEAYKWHRLALEKQRENYQGIIRASDDFELP
jgi:hypothetical protein